MFETIMESVAKGLLGGGVVYIYFFLKALKANTANLQDRVNQLTAKQEQSELSTKDTAEEVKTLQTTIARLATKVGLTSQK